MCPLYDDNSNPVYLDIERLIFGLQDPSKILPSSIVDASVAAFVSPN